jgi:hypothetical protein
MFIPFHLTLPQIKHLNSILMKKIILFLSVFALLASCEKDDPVIDKGQLDPNAMITIRPGAGVRATVEGLTALEVVEQALAIKFQSHYFGNVYNEDVKDIARSFRDEDKDYEAPALLMPSIDVITVEGEYYRDFTHSFNVFITDNQGDTIAYVPDTVINAARPLIETAYENEDYTEVYRLFDEAFTFLPIPISE